MRDISDEELAALGIDPEELGGQDDSDTAADLDALNARITEWIAANADAPWSENAASALMQELLQNGGFDTTRDILIAAILKTWPGIGLEKRSLQKAWKCIEDIVYGNGKAERSEVTIDERLEELGIPNPPEWDSPVNGADLAAAIEAEFRKYVTVADAYYPILTLWCMHTYCLGHEWLDVSPRLPIDSPTAGCGKSTCMRVLRSMSYHPVMTASMTPAVMFRIIDEVGPGCTLFLDEIDSSNMIVDVSHIIKAGWKQNEAHVFRCGSDQDDNKPVKFAVFGAMAMSGIGRVLDKALQSRSIPVTLHGRTRSEAVRAERFKNVDSQRLQDTIMRQGIRWARDSEAGLSAVGNMPLDELVNRDADIFEPLWTIATYLGSEWTERFQHSLQIIMGHREAPSALIGNILTDVVRIAASEARYRTESGNPIEWHELRITLAELLRGLLVIDAGKWAENIGGRPLTQYSIERMLRPFRPMDQKELSRRTESSHDLTSIQGRITRPGLNQTLRTQKPDKRGRHRALFMSDMLDAVSRYVSPDDITEI